jgi:hypothetical protein
MRRSRILSCSADYDLGVNGFAEAAGWLAMRRRIGTNVSCLLAELALEGTAEFPAPDCAATLRLIPDAEHGELTQLAAGVEAIRVRLNTAPSNG